MINRYPPQQEATYCFLNHNHMQQKHTSSSNYGVLVLQIKLNPFKYHLQTYLLTLNFKVISITGPLTKVRFSRNAQEGALI